jgi:DHA1 family tetracycline resistance protein-like MFS transporter
VTDATTAANSRRAPALGFIFITLILDVLGFGLLIPVGPKLVQSLLHNGNGGTDAEAATMFSILMSTWYAMSFVFASILGGLSDRFGRRPVILIALIGSGIDYFAQALSPTLTILFITRAINGISGASFTVASAYVADVTPPEKRAAGFGMIGAAFGLGFVIGPLIGGVLGDPHIPLPLLGHGGIRIPFYAAGILTLINALYGIFVLPESLPPQRRAPFHLHKAHPIAAYARLRHYPLVLGFAISLFLFNLAQIGLHSTWALSTMHRFNWTPVDVGLSLFAVGIGAAIVQGGLARKLIPALGEGRSVMIGAAFGVVCFLSYGLAPYGWIIYATIVVGSLGGIGQPATQSLITKSVRPDEQGAVQGTLMSLQSIAGILGPLLGGGVFSYFVSRHPGPPTEPWSYASMLAAGSPFLMGAALCAIGWAAAAWALRFAPADTAPAREAEAELPLSPPPPGRVPTTPDAS